MIYLIDVPYLRLPSGAAGAERGVIRFGNRAFISRPDDSPPDIRWFDGLVSGGNFAQALFGANKTNGPAQSDWGALEMVNPEGAYSWLLYGSSLSGGGIEVRQGPEGAKSLREFTPLARLSVSGAEFADQTISFRVRDALQTLRETLICPRRFKGDNIAPDGLEGGEALKDQPFPQVIGAVRNVPLPCCNVPKLIYAVSATVAHGVHFGGGLFAGGQGDSGIYDRGAPYQREADYTSLADLLANEPSEGRVRLYPGGPNEPAYLRLGSIPQGEVTATFCDGTGEQATIAALVRRLASIGGIVLDPSVTAPLASLLPGVGGFWAAAGEAIGAALDALLGGASAYLVQKPDGAYATGLLTLPGGVPVAHLTENEVREPKITASEYDGQPVWKVTIRYAPNGTVQSADSLAGYAADLRAELDWRSRDALTAVAEDPAIKARFPLAQEITLTCPLTQSGPALALAKRLLALHGQPRAFIGLSVPLEKAGRLVPGALVTVSIKRFGLAARPFWILARAAGLTASEATLTLWG